MTSSSDPKAFAIRPIDVVVVKGKTKPVTILEVFDRNTADRARRQVADPGPAAVRRRSAVAP